MFEEEIDLLALELWSMGFRSLVFPYTIVVHSLDPKLKKINEIMIRAGDVVKMCEELQLMLNDEELTGNKRFNIPVAKKLLFRFNLYTLIFKGICVVLKKKSDLYFNDSKRGYIGLFRCKIDRAFLNQIQIHQLSPDLQPQIRVPDLNVLEKEVECRLNDPVYAHAIPEERPILSDMDGEGFGRGFLERPGQLISEIGGSEEIDLAQFNQIHIPAHMSPLIEQGATRPDRTIDAVQISYPISPVISSKQAKRRKPTAPVQPEPEVQPDAAAIVQPVTPPTSVAPVFTPATPPVRSVQLEIPQHAPEFVFQPIQEIDNAAPLPAGTVVQPDENLEVARSVVRSSSEETAPLVAMLNLTVMESVWGQNPMYVQLGYPDPKANMYSDKNGSPRAIQEVLRTMVSPDIIPHRSCKSNLYSDHNKWFTVQPLNSGRNLNILEISMPVFKTSNPVAKAGNIDAQIFVQEQDPDVFTNYNCVEGESIEVQREERFATHQERIENWLSLRRKRNSTFLRAFVEPTCNPISFEPRNLNTSVLLRRTMSLRQQKSRFTSVQPIVPTTDLSPIQSANGIGISSGRSVNGIGVSPSRLVNGIRMQDQFVETVGRLGQEMTPSRRAVTSTAVIQMRSPEIISTAQQPSPRVREMICPPRPPCSPQHPERLMDKEELMTIVENNNTIPTMFKSLLAPKATRKSVARNFMNLLTLHKEKRVTLIQEDTNLANPSEIQIFPASNF